MACGKTTIAQEPDSTMSVIFLVILAIAALPVVLAYGYAIVTFAIFPLVTRRDPDPAPGVRRDRARAFAIEGAAQLWAFCVAWMHLAPSPRIVCPGLGRPIVLLPGYTETAGTLWILGRRLNSLTGRPVAALNHRPGLYASIKRLACGAMDDIERIRALTGGGEVDLVGHSMGGLVSRYLVERLGFTGVRAIVTLGTPHEGARLARTRTGACATQMIPGSDFLELLKEGNPAAPVVRLASVGSLVDNIVQPVSSAVAPRGEHVWFGDVAHVGLLFDPAVAREVARLLS